MGAIHPDQITAAEAVLRPYITDAKVSIAGLAMQVVNAYMDAAPGKKKREAHNTEPDGFDTFYQSYPRKVGRRAAAQAYGRALTRAAAETILGGAKRYAATTAGTEERFIKHPATWLNGDHWGDEMGNLTLVGGKDLFEDASPGEWQTRLDIFFGLHEDFPKFTWRESWGAQPFDPATKVPNSVKRTFQNQHRNLDFAGLKKEFASRNGYGLTGGA